MPMDIEENKMFDPELLPVKPDDSIKTEVQKIIMLAHTLQQENLDKPVIITVSKGFNDSFMQYLGWDEYWVKLFELGWFKYSVSPFINDDRKYIISYFDYWQLLGQWNAFNDVLYTLDDLFKYYDWTNDTANNWNSDWATD